MVAKGWWWGKKAMWQNVWAGERKTCHTQVGVNCSGRRAAGGAAAEISEGKWAARLLSVGRGPESKNWKRGLAKGAGEKEAVVGQPGSGLVW